MIGNVEIYLIIGLFLCLGITLLFVSWVSKKYGEESKENEIAEANIDAAKKSKETEKAIKMLSDAELDALMRERLSKKRGE